MEFVEIEFNKRQTLVLKCTLLIVPPLALSTTSTKPSLTLIEKYKSSMKARHAQCVPFIDPLTNPLAQILRSITA